jgi:hypothetical protein
MCFIWISEQTAIISLYSINCLVFITETECVYCAVRTGSLYIIQVIYFVWIWEQTAIISLYNINWLVCVTETECVYCAVRTESLNVIQVNRSLFSGMSSFHKTPHSSAFTSCSYQDKQANAGRLPKRMCFRKSGSVGEKLGLIPTDDIMYPTTGWQWHTDRPTVSSDVNMTVT